MLSEIQTRLNAPKNQYNNFGKYKYRSTEDIMEGLKPLLKEFKASVILSDELKLVGDRYYICACAELFNEEMKLVASNTSYAREELTKKGMDSSQITGTASSYARKYALNGLFAIDDTKDADSMDNAHKEEVKKVDNSKVSAKQVTLIQTRLSKLKIDEDTVSMLKSHYNIESWKDFPAVSMPGLLEWLDKKETA